MENFESGITEESKIKNFLALEVQKNNPENFNFVIKNISESFNTAIQHLEDKQGIQYAIDEIKRNENWLAEKYRETSDERAYLKNVNDTVTYLSKLL